MRRTLFFGLVLLLAGSASAAFQGNPNFRDVAITCAADGRTAFAGAGRLASVDGVVTLERFAGVESLAGCRRVKGDGPHGMIFYLVKAK